MVLWRSNEQAESSKSPGMVSDLGSIVKAAWAQRRPVLHHLNADTTWLVQLPIPSARPGDYRWLNILVDPWLFGPQSDVASWFSKQWHAISPALASIEEVEDLCRRVEDLTEADEADQDRPNIDQVASTPPTPSPSTPSPIIDAVILSHEFTDHTHKPTLLQLPKSTRIYATTKSAALVRSWDYFETVVEIPVLKDVSKWKDQTANLVPSQGIARRGDTEHWVGVGRLQKSGDAFYYHSAVSITFDLGKSGAEAIVYTPHGVKPDALGPLQPPSSSDTKGGIRVLALLHGLHDVSLDWGQQLNLGAFNALSAQRVVDSRYWIGTHDEVKKGGGVVALFLRRKVYTVREALAKEAQGTKLEKPGEDEKSGWLGWSRRPETQGGGDDLASLEKGGVDVGRNGRYFEMQSGESLALL